MKRLLIISYYWPPSGGAGVQRWLKFAKYLRTCGWEPIVYTPLNPEYPSLDENLERDVPEGISVLKTPIIEPYGIYKWFNGMRGSTRVQPGFINEAKRPGRAAEISAWIRGNLFIPDARCLWIKPSIRFLIRWLKENPVDAMVSTGPPHSMHLIALGIKKKLNLPWIADFRDPWTQIDFYQKLRLTKWANARHKKLEREVLSTADSIVTVSKTCGHDLREICGRTIEIVTNGFDEDDFQDIEPFLYDRFSITHLGSLNADRNPFSLWDALQHLAESDAFFSKMLTIRLIGKTDVSILDALEARGLIPFLEKTDYLPHDKALRMASQSAVLLLAVNNSPNKLGIATGKVYEYIALKRPILAIGPENGDAASIVVQTESGKVAEFEDRDKIIEILLEWKRDFLERKLDSQVANYQQYTRLNLTRVLAGILSDCVEKSRTMS